MRRLIGILFLLVAVAALATFGTAAGGEEDTYEVRAIFDNGAFLVPDEEVRIAGAKVGRVTEVDVTGVDEAAHEDGSPEPGKAVVVMAIDDPGFQDFREDASCFIRPQSLLGEKFVECQPTAPRAPESDPPPELRTIPDGEPGAGQHLLPLESNGKAVDIDLVNDIMREPYPDRFRLILNDLGAGLAARGEDLAEVVRRANPALKSTDEVLAILARQNKQLSQLARDGDQAIGPLAQQREHLGNFINAASTTAAATAERRADLEAGFQKLPGFLRELEATMTELDNFATSSTPVIGDLGAAAPDLTRINRALGPVAKNGTPALKTLGDAARTAGPDLVASQPVLEDLADLARSSAPVGDSLNELLQSLRTTNGTEYLMGVLYGLSGAVNSFDSYGHFLRAYLPLNNCVDYDITPTGGGGSSCNSLFGASSKAPGPAKASDEKVDPEIRRLALEAAGVTRPPPPTGEPVPDAFEVPGTESPEEQVPTEPDTGEEPVAPEGDPDAASAETDMKGAKVLLDYLLGSGDGGKR
jgi:ABC-type transporter Mla subunit MlaD